MGGLFGVVSEEDCVRDVFYGTDYHSHLGTSYGGLSFLNRAGVDYRIHDISNSQFKSKFEDFVVNKHGRKGIGVISDYEPQPLSPHSHLGSYAIATVGRINNSGALIRSALKGGVHFLEMSHGKINPTELVATLVDKGGSFEEGIENVQENVKGSVSLLILTKKGIYAARDKLGRTPLVIGRKEGSYAVASETSAFPTLGFEVEKYLGPGEIVFISEDGVEQKKEPGNAMQICSFLWVYFGFPASHYEGINVESVRYRCGAAQAIKDREDGFEADFVAGIPDSGTGHAIGYTNEAKIPYKRPFVKYTPTWPRSFMPTEQKTRNVIARMKLIPIREIIDGAVMVVNEDSIVRGTQLEDQVGLLYDYGAAQVHMRPACPPLVYGCNFLNFSRSRSEFELAARKAIMKIEGSDDVNLEEYSCEGSEKYCAMVDAIKERLGLTSLRYQRLDDLVRVIGLPKKKLCTHCWDGSSYF